MAQQGRSFLPTDLKQVSSARIHIEVQDLQAYMEMANNKLMPHEVLPIQDKVNAEINRLQAELHLRYAFIREGVLDRSVAYLPEGLDITDKVQAIFGTDLVVAAWTIDYPFLTPEEVAQTYQASKNLLTFTALMGVEFINGRIVMMEADEGGLIRVVKGSAYDYGKPRPV